MQMTTISVCESTIDLLALGLAEARATWLDASLLSRRTLRERPPTPWMSRPTRPTPSSVQVRSKFKKRFVLHKVPTGLPACLEEMNAAYRMHRAPRRLSHGL